MDACECCKFVGKTTLKPGGLFHRSRSLVHVNGNFGGNYLIEGTEDTKDKLLKR